MRDQRIDMARGFFVLSMVIYHGLYDLVFLFGKNINLENFYYFQQFIAFGFILISGLSQNLSRQGRKNALKLLLAAGLVQATTYWLMPQEYIRFGILHFLALAGFLTSFFPEIKDRKKESLLLLGLLVLFIGTKRISSGQFFWTTLPASLYEKKLYVLGLPGPNFQSADYYPLIPWIFLYWIGFIGGKRIVFQKKEKSHRLLAKMGRHSLFIYLVHQPIIYALLSLIYSKP